MPEVAGGSDHVFQTLAQAEVAGVHGDELAVQIVAAAERVVLLQRPHHGRVDPVGNTHHAIGGNARLDYAPGECRG